MIICFFDNSLNHSAVNILTDAHEINASNYQF